MPRLLQRRAACRPPGLVSRALAGGPVCVSAGQDAFNRLVRPRAEPLYPAPPPPPGPAAAASQGYTTPAACRSRAALVPLPCRQPPHRPVANPPCRPSRAGPAHIASASPREAGVGGFAWRMAKKRPRARPAAPRVRTHSCPPRPRSSCPAQARQRAHDLLKSRYPATATRRLRQSTPR